MVDSSPHPTHDPVTSLLGKVPSMLAYWGSDLRCRFANQAYKRWFGVDPQDLVGTSLRDLLGPTLFALNEPHIFAALNGEPQEFERLVPGTDGVARYSLTHYLPDVVDGVVAGFVVQVTEITRLHELELTLRAEIAQRERANALLIKSEKALRQAQTLGQIGSWEWDVAADIISWSPEMYRIFAFDPTRLPPSYAAHARFYAALSWTQLDMAVKRCLATGEPYRLELEYRRSDGATGWIEARGEAARDEDGKVIALHGTAQEVTAQRKVRAMHLHDNVVAETRRELHVQLRKISDLERALAQAKKLEVLGLLAGGISHDFNNVLAAVSGAFHMLKRSARDERSQEFIERGQRGVERATRLVRQLMGFARTQALDAEELDVGEALHACRELLQITAGPRIQLTLQAERGHFAHVDPNQLEVALLNLVINARDAMPTGGELAVSLAVVPAPDPVPGAPVNAGAVCVVVRDAGRGMAPDVLARAREPFFTTKGAGEGTGLGLAMVSAFALRSGGRFNLDSAPGLGTTATISLPLLASDTPRTAAAVAEPIDYSLHGSATVLVVDDDEMVRLVAVGYLEELGYTVLQASNASEALKIVNSTRPISLVLSDVAMPVFDGIDLSEQIGKSRGGLPVLLMTGHSDRRRLVGEEVLDKPFTLATLAARVLRLLGRSAAPASRLAARIRHPALRSLYATWSRSHSAAVLPPVAALELEACGAPECVFVAEVIDLAPFSVRRTHVGAALQRYTEQRLLDEEVSADDDNAFGGLEAAYRRCMRLREPSYEYIRFRRDDGKSVVFERLLLPCEDLAASSHQLVGMVIFENLPEAT